MHRFRHFLLSYAQFIIKNNLRIVIQNKNASSISLDTYIHAYTYKILK